MTARATSSMSRLISHWSPRWAMVVVLLVATLFRMYQLGEVPPGFQFDEAHNAIDAADVISGTRSIFFPDNGGREPLATYLHAPLLAALGRQNAAVSLRLASALVGIISIAVTYRAFAAMTGDRRLAVLSAAFLAISYWHVHFSRYGIRAILAPLWTTAAIWAWWRAAGPWSRRIRGVRARSPVMRALTVRSGTAWALLCGLFMATAVYSHPSGRLLPIVIVGHGAYRIWVCRGGTRRTLRRLAIAGITSLLLFLPLGIFFLHHPTLFVGHPSDVSLAAVAAQDYGGSIARALAANAIAVGGMFFASGDPSTFHNLPGLPVFDPVSAVAMLLGVGVLIGALATGPSRRRERAVVLVLWLVVMLLPTLLSDRPPNYSRAIAALPVIVTLPALGLRWFSDGLSRRWSGVGKLVTIGALLVAGAWTGWQYFVVFGTRTEHVYYSYDVDKLAAYSCLSEMARGAEVYLAPLWANHATIAFLNADGELHTLDPTKALVFPASGRDVVLALPSKEAEREGWSAEVSQLIDNLAAPEDLLDDNGKSLATTYRLSASAVGDLEPPTDAPLEPQVWTKAVFGGSIRLLGYSVQEAVPGERLPIRFWWRSVEPLPKDLTWFVHLVGPAAADFGQHDAQPGGGSYPTSAWEPGDVVIGRYEPVLAADASGMLQIQVGWYDLATGERLEVGDDTVFRLRTIELAP